MYVAADCSDFDDVYPALGRLVLSSSYLEGRLRYLVGWLAATDEASIVFDGQSTDWLIQSAKAMLGELKQTGAYALQDCGRFEAALARAKELNNDRNFFVHGEWSIESGDDLCIPRPKSRPIDERVFYIARSRLRKVFQEHEVAVVDVELLAGQMFELGREITAAVDEGHRLRFAWEALHPPTVIESHDDIDVLLEALQRKARRQGGHP
ncbi:hypothetical protein ABZ942_19735 [Nocardia sp. NPDC046473]|uniref:hypothetical protein n=1 Tax=Nocardia sp. NPDC046473 TaxID=3155733 RepID=UPI0033F42C30